MEILVVEDDSSSARIYADILKYWGHAVFSAATAREALVLVAARPFDSALVDLILPDSDGFALIEKILQVQPRLKCLLVSGVYDPDAARKARELRAEFRSKPLDMKEVERLLRGQPARV